MPLKSLNLFATSQLGFGARAIRPDLTKSLEQVVQTITQTITQA
jgi:hypothetical protein